MKLDVRRLNRILSYLFEDMRTLSDSDRELPIKWSMMHMYSSSNLACLVALKRNLNPELLGIIAALHDIGAIKTKKRENHAFNASPFVYEIINHYNSVLKGNLSEITDLETKIIHEAVINHGKKDIDSNFDYIEAMKDIDSLDRYLHGVNTTYHHETRLKNMLELFGINITDN